jgi:transposase
MRGEDRRQDVLFSYVSIEDRIPEDHPLRAIRSLVEPILTALSPRFQTMYSDLGRPSIPPEQLLRALLLQILFTIRSERQLIEQLNYNLLFRWFVGLTPDEPVWVPTVFTKNRDRLLGGNIAEAFCQEVLKAADARSLLSHEHFSVDGTLLEAWASQKSFRPKNDPSPPPSDGDKSNPTVNFRKEKRSNATHQSVTDPDARLARKSNGTTAKLCYLGSTLMDNRHGLVVATDVRPPAYEAERDAAVEMLTTLESRSRRRTLGADKGYDTDDFVDGVRQCHTTPHVTPNVHEKKSRWWGCCGNSVTGGGRRWGGSSLLRMACTTWCGSGH